MKNETISFSTGNLIINETTISFHQKGGNLNQVNTIARENIGNVDKEPMRVLPKTDITYCFLLGIVGIIIIILGGMAKSHGLSFAGIAIMAIGLLLFFCLIFIDGLLGISVGKPILTALFGVDAVRVVVQNVFGGNNLHFLIIKDDEKKLPQFQDYKLVKTKSNAENTIQESTKNNIDDIEKLASLKEKGLITSDEYEQKKKQILGL